jgi:hypothetical protein
MKTRFNFIAVAAIALTLAFSACGSQEQKTPATVQSSTTEKVLYTCPMHPEVRSDKPGKCPKCGMDLIKVEKVSDTTVVKK